jgi:hypothetical protein
MTNSGGATIIQGRRSGFKSGGQDSGVGGLCPQKLTHFCETNMIFGRSLQKKKQLVQTITLTTIGVASNYVCGSQSNAEGASSRRRRRRGMGCGEGCSRPRCGGSRKGVILAPQKIFEFFIWKLCLLVDPGALKLKVA